MEKECNTNRVKVEKGIPTHGGKYVQYSVLGNLFEVSSKYAPPIQLVGAGAYGIVCCATDSETKEDVAIKKIGNAFDNRIDAKRTLREIKLLCHMDHDNVIKIKDIIPPPQRENFVDVYIAYELMDTDLHQIIRSSQALTEDHCQYFLYQLLRGLKYIHSANVLHRDLKPSNLLLNANCDLKICDFGLARTTSETDFMTEYVVTRWYRAPELLLNCSEYTAAIDIWSVGCILMEIIKREPLFPGKDYVQQLGLITEYFLYQLLRGLKYIHSANVLHRDLKPSNLLLNANCDLKICDFGLARTTSETDFMTEYVVTRWYRAPELLLNCSEYTAAIDIWSVGCILMEIIKREPLFPGKDYVQQLGLITELLGSPEDSDLGFLRSDNARNYVKQLPHVPKRPFSEKFPDVSPVAIDLAEQMLIFDPSKRITVEEALNHPFLSSIHEINEEPTCQSSFVFDFEQASLSEEDVKELIWLETFRFNTDEILELSH